MSCFFIDTHCHLDLFNNIEKNPTIEDQLPIKTISVTNAPFLFDPNNSLLGSCKNIRVALGLHPELVTTYHSQLTLFEERITATRYIGEVGLDKSSQHKNSFELQKRVFERLLNIVRVADDKILTIHSRNAANETINILGRILKNSACKIILHWYSGNIDDLKTAVDSGFYFSVNHKMINTMKGMEIIKNIPEQLLLTETDAPFTLSNNIPTRIKSLETTIEGIAKLKNLEFEQVRRLVYSNFTTLLKT